MPRREIKHKMSWKELDNLTDDRLVPILRAKGMDVVYRPFAERTSNIWGCVAAPGTTFNYDDNVTGFHERVFTWRGEVELTEEEKAAASFLQSTRTHVDVKVRVEDQSATRCIRLED